MEFLTRLSNEIGNQDSAAAASSISIAIPAGEIWVVHQVCVRHNDPAPATLAWRVIGEGGLLVEMPIGVTAQDVIVRFTAYYTTPVLMAPTWVIRLIATSGSLAAGKQFFAQYHIQRLRGVPAGSFL